MSLRASTVADPKVEDAKDFQDVDVSIGIAGHDFTEEESKAVVRKFDLHVSHMAVSCISGSMTDSPDPAMDLRRLSLQLA